MLNRKNTANKEKRNNEGDQTEEDNDQEEVFTLLFCYYMIRLRNVSQAKNKATFLQPTLVVSAEMDNLGNLQFYF